MKLISLNIWGGRAGFGRLLKFFSDNKDADIFCLQEVWNGGEEIMIKRVDRGNDAFIVPRNLISIASILSDFNYYFHPQVKNYYGLTVFVKKTLAIKQIGELFVHKDRELVGPRFGAHGRNIQYIVIETNNRLRTIINFHGLWTGDGKDDNNDRLVQSNNIINFLKTQSNPIVLVGDFNLLPETESIKKFEIFGMRNLIREGGFVSTRTKLYTKEHRFADYAFVTKDITIKNFTVMPDEVSDHSPLYLEFE